MKRVIAISVACACAAFCASGVSGCSGGSSTEPNDTAAVESAEQSQSNIGEEIAGRYKVDSSEIKNGLVASYYVFSADGSVKVLLLAAGEEYTMRMGTWTENDGNVLVNMPEVKETKVEGIGSVGFEAMTDVLFAFSDGTVSFAFNDGDTNTATKITDEQYQEDVATSKKFAPVRSKAGKTVKGNKCSFVVESIGFQDTIEPSDTSGYYTYSEAGSGNTFVLAKIKFTNNSSKEFLGPCTAATFEIDGESYDATVEVDGGDTLGTHYAVSPKGSNTVYISAEVGDKIKKAKKIKLIWNLPTDAKYFGAYYDSSQIAYKTYEISK